MGAAGRIAASDNDWLRHELLPALVAGETFATVGISHLTTSRQHLAQPVLRAAETAEASCSMAIRLGSRAPNLRGISYWARRSADGRQILLAVPTDLPGVRIARAPQLVGLSASRTGPVHLDSVRVAAALAAGRSACTKS